MGLDAYVPCSCLARGLAKPAPVEVAIDDGVPAPIREEDWDAFYVWRETACTHPSMEAISERVGNWASIRTLQDALGFVGEPVAQLLAVIPNTNGGSTDVATCRICLDELAAFRRLFKRITPSLVNATTGERVYDYVAAYDGLFLWSKTGDVGFDANGLYIAERTPRRIVFQARRVRAVPDGDGSVLHDVETAASRRCAWSQHVETSYEVVEHVETSADHAHKLDTLEKLFRAATEHDTCVVWC